MLWFLLKPRLETVEKKILFDWMTFMEDHKYKILKNRQVGYRTMITVRCKQCKTELTSSSKVQFCGCPNQMSIVDDKIGAVDLDKVVMVSYNREEKIDSHFSTQELLYQEERRKRKVRKLNFEIK